MIRSSADTVASHDETSFESRTDNLSICRHCGLRMFQHQGLRCVPAWPSQPAWQPIATAPKHTNDIRMLLCRPDGWICIGNYAQLTDEFVSYGRSLDPQPTFWMPLPAPPQIGSATEATDAERADGTRRSAAQK